MKVKHVLYIAIGVVIVLLFKSCASESTVDNSTNEQLLKRVGELEAKNKELKIEIEKLKDDNNILKSSRNAEKESIENPPVEANTKEQPINEPTTQPTNDREPGKKLSEKDRQELAIVFAQDYVEKQTGIKMSLAKGDFNVAIQNYSPKHDAYIVTYKDADNPRIKFIFDWDGIEQNSGGYYKHDPWYLLVNGTEYYNELDTKRENAINDK